MQLRKHLQSEIDGLGRRFIFCKAVNGKGALLLPGIKKRLRSVGKARLDTQRFVQFRSKSPAKNSVHYANGYPFDPFPYSRNHKMTRLKYIAVYPQNNHIFRTHQPTTV